MAKIALSQVNTEVGDFHGNTVKINSFIQQAVRSGAEIIVFPEMSLVGYPGEDLVLDKDFQLQANVAFESVVERCQELPANTFVVIGHLGVEEGKITNRTSVVNNHGVVTSYDKIHLPNYGVFDEKRVFQSGDTTTTFDFTNKNGVTEKFGLAICEDIWETKNNAITFTDKLDVLLVLNGSPYEQHKQNKRRSVVSDISDRLHTDIVYVNLVGGQDDVVFDGKSFVFDRKNDKTGVVLQAKEFQEDAIMWDSLDDTPVEPVAEHENFSSFDVKYSDAECSEVYRALTLSLKDYVIKNGFSSVVLGVSGGIDSALVAAIAADALGGENVYGISMPSDYSSDHSKSDAEELMENLGGHYHTTAISPMMNAFQDSLHLTGVAEENIQARIRGVILMAASNTDNHLVLATGNKSELAVGYSTIYGDAVGGFAPLKDIPKTLVFALSKWRNTQSDEPVIPVNTITKPPSAELRPGQVDQETLPEYDVLDSFLEDYIGFNFSKEVLSEAYGAELVEKLLKMIKRAEWKRRQYPPGTKVSSLSFGKDRRMPITTRFEK